MIDAFAGTITGWECSASKSTAFVQRAISHAAQHLRRTAGGPVPGRAIHHSDYAEVGVKPRNDGLPCSGWAR